MRTKSSNKFKSISLKKKLSELNILELAKESSFQIRAPRKISVVNLILGFFDCCVGNSFSLMNWSFRLGKRINGTVSKQAVSERINQRFLRLLQEAICRSLNTPLERSGRKILRRFGNVYVQDSSCVGLPDTLKDIFHGNFSNGKIKSVAKLQVVFNLAKGVFSGFSLSAYSRNDQAASWDIMPILKKGDLVVRDMGYFVMGALIKIKEKKAEFITRLKTGVALFDPATAQPLNLPALLRGRTFLKKQVLIGTKEKIPVVLMAIKTTNAISCARRKRLRQDRDRRKKITWEKLMLSGWDIFVCSMDDLSGEEIKEIYRLRWQIEIIFKSWKTHLRIEKNTSRHLKKPYLFSAMIYLTLLMVTLIIMPIYRILTKIRDNISLLKLTQLLTQILPLENWELKPKMIQILIYHSSYDKRRRPNANQKLKLLT